MALQARTLNIPAGLPIDEATRPELLDAGAANLENVNVRMNKRGGLDRRLGFRALSQSRINESNRDTGYRLFSHNGVPTVIDGFYLDSYIEGLEASVVRSRVPGCSYRQITLPQPAAAAVLYDLECCAGYVAVVYGTELNGTCKAAVVDATTGAVIRPPETIGSADGRAFVTAFGGQYFVAFVREQSSGDITAHILDTEDIEAGWTSLAAVVSSSAAVTPAVCSLESRVAIVYALGAGTDRVVVQTYDESGLLETRAIGTSSTTPAALAVGGSVAGTLWVAWEQANDINVIGLDAEELATTRATQATALQIPNIYAAKDIGICEGEPGTARIWAISDETPATLRMTDIDTVSGAASPGSETVVYGVRPISRPFYAQGRHHMVCSLAAEHHDLTVSGSNSQGLCVVVDWTENLPYLRPVANIEPGLIVSATANAKVSRVGPGRYLVGYQVTTHGEVAVGSAILKRATLRSAMAELSFLSRDRWQPASHAGSTFLGGALTSVFDGERVTEVGFLCRPTKPSTFVSGNGITGSFRYVAVYEDVDAAGNWVVSGISTPSDVATASNQMIMVSTQTLTVSSRIAKGTTRVVFYRTADGGEPPYYRLAALDNDPTSGMVIFEDYVNDVTGNALLYAPNLPGTAGESQDRRAPPGLMHLVSYNGMLVGARGESLFYSGQEVYGEATWFSPVFEVPVTGGGDITGLRAIDGTLFVFKADRIYAVAGEAPSDNGLQGGLGPPRLLASDVGCIEPSSLLVTSLGIFFQSRRGIELLTRAQAVEYIGQPVQETLARYPIVTSAVLDDRNSLARFTLAGELDAAGLVRPTTSGEGADGNARDVIYDLSAKAWVSVDAKTGGMPNEGAQSAAQICLAGEWRYAWLSAGGTVYVERDPDDANAYLDGSAWIDKSYTLPPIKVGLQQEQRIYEVELLFERHDAAGLAVDIAYDYSDTYTHTRTWDEDDLVDERQVALRPTPQTTAVQLRVRETEPAQAGTGRGLTFVGVSADIAPKQGPTRGTTRLAPELRR